MQLLEARLFRVLPKTIGMVFLAVCAPSAVYPAGAFEADETLGSCLSAQAQLLTFTTPEKTWAYFLKSLRAADRKAALNAFLQGDLKIGFSHVLDSMDAEKMRSLADSFGPLTQKREIGGGIQEFLVIRASGAQSTGALVEFEYHPNCGGWRIATM
jgi:hypothetical protein